MSGRGKHVKSERERANLRAAMDCPIVRAIIGKKIAQSWKDPAIRARRIAGLIHAAKDPTSRAKRKAKMPARDRRGRFVGGDL